MKQLEKESQKVLHQELKNIKKWEKGQRGSQIWHFFKSLPFKFLDKITPKIVHDKLGALIDEIVIFIQNGGEYLVKEKNVLKLLHVSSIEEIEKLPLKEMDQAAEKFRKQAKNIAFTQGATTGVGGLFTLTIDIPAVLFQSLKVLQEMALCYGFDPKEKEERIFIMKCLQFASSDVVGKKAILDELEKNKHKQLVSQVQGWREVVASYTESFSLKKIFQMVPIAGILFGAFSNKLILEDISEVGMMFYKKRRILLKIEEVK
ncbi:MAG TPA: EcsC family protein [Massilibacterium sp.]|nr:EcsC family protein [Massilibacterium sp.]